MNFDVVDRKRNSKPKSHHRRSKRRRSLPERGWIQLLTLRVINEEPMHGYQLIDEMEGRNLVEIGRFETGSIYTILNRMEKAELLVSEKIEADSGRIRRVYNVTPKGVEVLREGLLAVKKRKKITDELVDYYEKTFADNKNITEA
jgi:DNA-binding PadR family transcriptional regulator